MAEYSGSVSWTLTSPRPMESKALLSHPPAPPAGWQPLDPPGPAEPPDPPEPSGWWLPLAPAQVMMLQPPGSPVPGDPGPPLIMVPAGSEPLTGLSAP